MGAYPALDVRPPAAPQDTVSQIQNLLALKQMVQEQPVRQQILANQAQTSQIGVQQAQQGQQDQQAFRAAISDPSNQGKTLGDIADTLASKGSLSPQGLLDLKKADISQRQSLATLNKDQLENAKAVHDQTQQLYNNAMSLPDDQLAQNWPQIAQQYDQIQSLNPVQGQQRQLLSPQQPLTKQQLQQFGPFLSMQNAYLDDAMQRQKAQTGQQEAETTLAQKKAESQFYQQNGGAPGVPTELMQEADWLKKNPGKGPADYKLWTLQHTPTAMVMGNQLGGDQNQQALDFAADNYRKTGQMPPGLSRSPGSTIAIIQRAAQLDQQAGGGGIAANKADLGSLTDALKKVQTTASSVQAFEDTASKNMDLLQQTAQKIPDLGTRFANVPVRMINSQMIGTANMASFKTALATAQTEAAKVLNSSNATGVLSDSSRHELQDIIDGNAPLPAMVASLNTLKQDMNNRTTSYQQQIKDLQGRIKGVGGGTQQSAPGGGGALSVTAPNGKVYSFKDQASADAFRKAAGIQ